jgi:hypothetical protein
MNGNQITLFEDNPEYDAFVEKFKPKKTTDDCYTPPYIYDAVHDWAVKEYGLQGRTVVRPFYPGGDYENHEYPDGCVVLDNPPFSILSKIIRFYNEREIDYFLFAPALTVLSSCKTEANAIITDSEIVYENGAKVRTAFVTNLGEHRIHVSSELHGMIEDAQKRALRTNRVTLPKYVYPDCVLTAATIQKIAKYGQSLKIRPEDCHFIRAIDSQKATGKSVFGGGMLLSEKAAAEKAAAEKAAAEKAAATRWALSDRELAIVSALGG